MSKFRQKGAEEQMWSSHLTTKIGLLIFLLNTLLSCRSKSGEKDNLANILNGTISYPFGSARAVGFEGNRDKLVLKSLSGPNEYTIEIPHDHDDIDLEIPMSELNSGQGITRGSPFRRNPSKTDRELTARFPDISRRNKSQTELLDSAFGVTPSRMPQNAPSYTIGLAKINELYKRHQYEYALIEIDHLRSFFPTSPRLLKMKGTVLIKLRNYEMALDTWKKALELKPRDRVLKKSIARLEKRISALRDDSLALQSESGLRKGIKALEKQPNGRKATGKAQKKKSLQKPRADNRKTQAKKNDRDRDGDEVDEDDFDEDRLDEVDTTD